jgi:diguanylate cyclase (GGDEF)-like protein/PAS domain S-box-containing protein
MKHTKNPKFYTELIENNHDAILVVSKELEITYANNSFNQVSGFKEDEIIGQKLSTFVNEKDKSFLEKLIGISEDLPQKQFRAEFRLKTQNGDERWVKMVANDMLSSTEVQGIVLNLYDITEIKEDHDIIHRLAFHDNLIGLSNRTLFRDRLKHTLAFSRRYNTKAAILSIDLDLFNNIKDYTDIEIEDNILIQAANAIVKSLRQTDTVSRQGNDELLVILNELNNEEDAITVAQKICESLKLGLEVQKKKYIINPHIGLSIYPNDAYSSEQLITFADIAMIEAKNLGKNIVRIRGNDIRKPDFATTEREKQFS